MTNNFKIIKESAKYAATLEKEFEKHDKISSTADLIAFWRSFSNIPYALEISELSQAKETTFELFNKYLPNFSRKQILNVIESITFSFGAPMIEARYKCLDKQIKKSGIKNIYEIAAGISPRSIILTENPEIIYFATDLPKKVSNNKKNLSAILKKHKLIRNNLYFYPVNALDEQQFLSIGNKLNGPICVVHEGLLPYFNRKEKSILGNNIKKLLIKKGGCWITPDIMCRDKMEERMAKRTEKEKEILFFVMSVIFGVSERDMIKNAFESEEDAESFFEDLGFLVNKFPKYDDNFNISSLKYLPDDLEKEKSLSFNKNGYIYVLYLDKNKN